MDFKLKIIEKMIGIEELPERSIFENKIDLDEIPVPERSIFEQKIELNTPRVNSKGDAFWKKFKRKK